MKQKKLFPVAAMLLVLLIGSCKKEENAVSQLGVPSEVTADESAMRRSPVNLGLAGSFVILSKSGITDVYPTAVTGDVGTSPITGAAIHLTCTEVSGAIYSVDAAGPLPCRVTNASRLTTAVSNMQTAYTSAAGRVSPDFVNLGAGTIGGRTLTKGLYKWTTGVLIPTDITISGGSSDIFIF